MHPFDELRLNLTRRTLLKGVGAIALGGLLNETRAADLNPLAVRHPHFAARAKHVIYLHMIGAPSQLDLFDHKPALVKHDGQPCPAELTKGKRFAFIGGDLTLAGSKFRFDRHGKSGQHISELLPHLATKADDLAIVRSLHSEEINHAPAQLFLHTGFGRGGRPGSGRGLSTASAHRIATCPPTSSSCPARSVVPARVSGPPASFRVSTKEFNSVRLATPCCSFPAPRDTNPPTAGSCSTPFVPSTRPS